MDCPSLRDSTCLRTTAGFRKTSGISGQSTESAASCKVRFFTFPHRRKCGPSGAGWFIGSPSLSSQASSCWICTSWWPGRTTMWSRPMERITLSRRALHQNGSLRSRANSRRCAVREGATMPPTQTTRQ